MAVLLVTYDLNSPGQDYKDLLSSIKSTGSWAKLSESSYAISTNETVSAWYDRLGRYIDKNDSIFIITLKRPYTGYGPKDVVDWLDSNLTY